MSILYYFCQEVGLKPGPDYGKLKTGKPVEFEGVLLKPEDFLGITGSLQGFIYIFER